MRTRADALKSLKPAQQAQQLFPLTCNLIEQTSLMPSKGGGRKGFVKAAAATKVAEAPPVTEEVTDRPGGQAYHESKPDGKKELPVPSVLSLPESLPGEGESRGQMLQRHKKVQAWCLQSRLLGSLC